MSFDSIDNNTKIQQKYSKDHHKNHGAIQEKLEKIERILKGGIDIKELPELLELVSQLGGAIPASLMTKIEQGLEDLIKTDKLSESEIKKILDLISGVMTKQLEHLIDQNTTKQQS